MTPEEELASVRAQLEQAADAGDESRVVSLSARYRDLQGRSGSLPRVGRFQPETGREFQLSQRALRLRQSGREDDANQVIRVIARERFARSLSGDNLQSRAAAFLFGGNRGLFNLGTIASGVGEFAEDITGNRNRVTARERVEDYSIVQDTVRGRHPVSAGAGEVVGVAATLPAAEATIARGASGLARVAPRTAAVLAPVPRASAIGIEARNAELIRRGGTRALIARGVSRGALAGGAFGAVQGASDAVVRDEDVVQGATEGATFGALAGPVVEGGLRAVGGLAEPILQRLSRDPLVRRIADRLQEPVSEVVRRMNRFYATNGRMPSAVEVLSPRTGREVSRTISGHGDAVERAIELSDEVSRARPSQVGEAIERNTPNSREASQDIVDNTSEAFTDTMRRIGDERVNLADEDLVLLNTRTAGSLFKLPDGVLSETGERVAEAFSQRQNAAAAAEAAREAQRLAAEAANNLRRNPSPTNARRVRDAVARLRNARARAAEAARAVKPVHLTIREIETLRHDIRRRAGDGNSFALNELSDNIRDLARRNGGQAGREYEMMLRYFASQNARAEGVNAGRAMARDATANSVAAAKGAGASRSLRGDAAIGGRQGVVGGLAEEAASGPRGMRGVTERLVNDENLGRGLDEVLGPDEAARLRDIGEINAEAADNLRTATPSRDVPIGEEIDRSKRTLLAAAVIAQGSTGGAFRAAFTEKLMSSLSIGRQQAIELAEMAFDPNRVGEFVNLLARFSGSAERMRQTMTRLVGVLPATVQRRWNDSTNSDAGQDEEIEQTADGSQPVAATTEEGNTAEPVGYSDVGEAFLQRLAEIESGGNANARARASSAAGLYQFTEGTWLEMMRRHGAELGLERVVNQLDDSSKRDAILQLRFDPEIAGRVVAAMTAENFNSLEQELGREPTPGELYAAHFLGLNGARRLLRAVETNVDNIVEEFPREARANRALFYEDGEPRSAAELLEELERKWR